MVGNARCDLIFGQHPHSRRDDSFYVRFPSGSVEAFDGHRVQIHFSYHTENYLKESGLSGNEVRKGGQVVLRLDKFVVLNEFCREPSRALKLIDRALDKALEHSIQWWREEEVAKLPGRKVWVKSLAPAVVDRVDAEDGHVYLRADTPSGEFPRFSWEQGESGFAREDPSGMKLEVLSDWIDWHRD